MTPVVDGLRLAFGTLTVLPVRPPGTVDRRSGGWAMTFAPLVGLVLAAVATAALWLLGWPVLGIEPLFAVLDRTPLADVVSLRPASPLLAATLLVGLLALLTRAIHLDGLADTVDGLGSGRPADQALAIMRKSDIGPFGVVALVLLLLAQVAALAQLVGEGRGPLALALALVVSRLALPMLCLAGVPAARNDGLGRAVAGSVSPLRLLAVAVASAVVLLLLVAAVTDPLSFGTEVLVRGAVAAGLALGAGGLVGWWCVRRLGGVTGDVLGCGVEVTFSVALVVLTML